MAESTVEQQMIAIDKLLDFLIQAHHKIDRQFVLVFEIYSVLDQKDMDTSLLMENLEAIKSATQFIKHFLEEKKNLLENIWANIFEKLTETDRLTALSEKVELVMFQIASRLNMSSTLDTRYTAQQQKMSLMGGGLNKPAEQTDNI